MKTAILTLCDHGAMVAQRLRESLPNTRLFVHQSVSTRYGGARFERIVAQTAALFSDSQGLIFVAPCGVATRAIAPCLEHKKQDPAVVVVDVGGRWAVSLLSGHEGGANQLAMRVANVLDAEPVISTTTEADKTLIAGVGCRRGVSADRVVDAVQQALQQVGAQTAELRLLASVDIKKDESGLLQASQRLAVPLRFISSAELRNTRREFARSELVQQKLALPAVAEPCALLAGRRTSLQLQRQIYQGVTVALARESCGWSALDPAAPSTAAGEPSEPSETAS